MRWPRNVYKRILRRLQIANTLLTEIMFVQYWIAICEQLHINRFAMTLKWNKEKKNHVLDWLRADLSICKHFSAELEYKQRFYSIRISPKLCADIKFESMYWKFVVCHRSFGVGICFFSLRSGSIRLRMSLQLRCRTAWISIATPKYMIKAH